jgi:hypothetical protein
MFIIVARPNLSRKIGKIIIKFTLFSLPTNSHYESTKYLSNMDKNVFELGFF